MAESLPPKLSICIATFKRGAFIGATLEAILLDLPNAVEIVIVDGASPDNTQEAVEPFVRRTGALRYMRQVSNSGLDRDYDKAVSLARGEYCWLMTDDDILVPGAVARVVAALDESPDLLVVNAKVCNATLGTELNARVLDIPGDRRYDQASSEEFLAEVGDYLSFIGGVIIRRSRWLERERERYFGTLFIHVGVIFQAPLPRVKVIADPLIVIRYGNAMWSSRGFEIWMFKWPDLIWSFDKFSKEARARVVAREPWRQWRRLMFYRAIGAYCLTDYRKFFQRPKRGGVLQYAISLLPAALANAVTAMYWALANRKARSGIYDLARSPCAPGMTLVIARRLNIPTG